MQSETSTVGFIGLGRLGLPLASHLIDAGYDVISTARGRSDEFARAGGRVLGDVAPRLVAEQAEVVVTCLQDDQALDSAVQGKGGLLDAGGTAPMVIQLGTASIATTRRLQALLSEKGGDLLDCPVSGTPEMAMAKKAVVFASGRYSAYERVAPLITALSPAHAMVGKLGAGTQFKYVANLLVFAHVTAAAEAMAFASAAGLDLQLVAKILSASPGATSGQFSTRASRMAAQSFEPPSATVDQMLEVCEQIVAHGAEIGAATPLTNLVKDLFQNFAGQGDGPSDPGKLFLYLQNLPTQHHG